MILTLQTRLQVRIRSPIKDVTDQAAFEVSVLIPLDYYIASPKGWEPDLIASLMVHTDPENWLVPLVSVLFRI